MPTIPQGPEAEFWERQGSNRPVLRQPHTPYACSHGPIMVVDPADHVFDRFKEGTIYLHDLIMGVGCR